MILQSVAVPWWNSPLKGIAAAYGVVFGAIFIFIWLMTRRQKALEKRLERLRDTSRRSDL